MIKLLFSDLDGTLTFSKNNETAVSDNSLNGLKMLKENNIGFCIASGRNDSHTEKIARLINWSDCDIISCNGACIRVDGHKTIYNVDFESFKKLADYFYNISDGHNFRMIGSRNDGYYVSDWLDDYFISKYTGRYGICKEYTLKDLIANPNLYPGFQKLQITNYTEDKTAWFYEIRQKFSSILDIGSPNSLQTEFMKYGCNKGSAIDFICQHYGLKKEEIAVVGDGDNDIAMFQKTPYSFAIADGDEKAREVAYRVVNNFEKCCKAIIQLNSQDC